MPLETPIWGLYVEQDSYWNERCSFEIILWAYVCISLEEMKSATNRGIVVQVEWDTMVVTLRVLASFSSNFVNLAAQITSTKRFCEERLHKRGSLCKYWHTKLLRKQLITVIAPNLCNDERKLFQFQREITPFSYLITLVNFIKLLYFLSVNKTNFAIILLSTRDSIC